MTKPIIRPATKADVIAFRGKPYDESFKGVVADLDGEIIGIAGVLHTEHLQAFSTIEDELKKYPKILVLAAREFRNILNSYQSTIYALASCKEKNSKGFLKYIGFERYTGRLYKWPNKAEL